MDIINEKIYTIIKLTFWALFNKVTLKKLISQPVNNIRCQSDTKKVRNVTGKYDRIIQFSIEKTCLKFTSERGKLV